MPRTKLTCSECQKEIPARDTKSGEAALISATTFENNLVNIWFCKSCAVEHKLGQYKSKYELLPYILDRLPKGD